MTKPQDLTAEARVGYDGNPNPSIRTSASWYAHELGRHLHDTGRPVPRDVRMGRGDSIRSGDLRFAFKLSRDSITFERVE